VRIEGRLVSKDMRNCQTTHQKMCSRPEPMTPTSRIPGGLPPEGVRWERCLCSGAAMAGQMCAKRGGREEVRRTVHILVQILLENS
jgi:hypothetical protein